MAASRRGSERVGENVRVADARDNGAPITPAPSREEAAAIVAAVERFVRATSLPAAPPSPAVDEWRRTALLEGVEREAESECSDPWINT
jgi:hypothetical protein